VDSPAEQVVQSLLTGFRVPMADGRLATLAYLLEREPWQKERFDAILPALLSVMGLAGKARHQYVWEETARGHSKSSDLALLATWAMCCSTRPIRLVAAAADKDQATIIRAAIALIVRSNPLLDWARKDAEGKRTGWLDCQADKVVNKAEGMGSYGSELNIISSDVASSYGTLADVIILDEVTHWPVKGEGLWSSLFSAAAKKPNCALICISNAGFKESWQWALREAIRNDPDWKFRHIDGPVASWITQEKLDAQRRLLMPVVFNRMWKNIWAEGAGDAIAEDLIQAALTQSGPMAWEQGWVFVAGLDIGLTRDACAFVVVGRHVGWVERTPKQRKRYHATVEAMMDLGMMERPPDEEDVVIHPATGRVRLGSVQIWRPSPGCPVQLEEVENAIVAAHRRYNLSAVGYDPWQAAYLAERLNKQGIGAVPIDPVPANLKAMASVTIETLQDKQLDIFPDPDLLRDLRALRVVERQYGVRLESPRGPSGHGDAASALANALLISKRLDLAVPREVSGPLVCWPA
jgi:phage terminase large subunit-like protein